MREEKRRAAFFIDGVFFTKINEVIRGNNAQQNLVIKHFISTVVEEIETKTGHKIELKQIDFFKGKFSIVQLEKIYKADNQKIKQHLYNERKLEDILTKNNITIHNEQAIIRRSGELVEKGIDVTIVIEALNVTEIDYFILISGDQDFLPLIKWLKKKGIKTATIEVDLTGVNNNYVKTASGILPIYDIVINLNDILKDTNKLNNLINFNNGKEIKA